ncbi:hypothetical protein ABPG72_014587 [Tetrahymena utriculariae]
MRVINSKKKIIVELNVINTFISKIQDKLFSDKYDFNQVINFDESTIFKQEIGNYTLAEQNEDHVIVKSYCNSRESYTIGLGISFTGEKLPQVIIWPSKGVKDVFKMEIPKNTLIFKRDTCSYFSQELFKKWINEVLSNPSKSMEIDKKGLLILDNFSGHSYDTLIQYLQQLNYEIEYLPANTTDRLQPLDLGINKIYKQKFKELCLEYQYLLGDEEQVKLSHGDFLLFLSQVWKEITSQNVQNSWKCYSQLIEDKNQIVNLLLDEKENQSNISDQMQDEQHEGAHNEQNEEFSNDSNSELSGSILYEFLLEGEDPGEEIEIDMIDYISKQE